VTVVKVMFHFTVTLEVTLQDIIPHKLKLISTVMSLMIFSHFSNYQLSNGSICLGMNYSVLNEMK
jgi:hypothetical protein